MEYAALRRRGLACWSPRARRTNSRRRTAYTRPYRSPFLVGSRGSSRPRSPRRSGDRGHRSRGHRRRSTWNRSSRGWCRSSTPTRCDRTRCRFRSRRARRPRLCRRRSCAPSPTIGSSRTRTSPWRRSRSRRSGIGARSSKGKGVPWQGSCRRAASGRWGRTHRQDRIAGAAFRRGHRSRRSRRRIEDGR